MKVVEVEEDTIEAAGSGGIRIFIKVDSAGKTTKLTLNLEPGESIEDVTRIHLQDIFRSPWRPSKPA